MAHLKIFSGYLGLVALFFLVGVASIAYAHFTRVHLLSQDIPPNLTCIHNTGADVYLCEAGRDPSWYLDWKRPE